MELILTEEVAHKLHLACNHDPSMEVGGFGKTTVLDNNKVLVTDIIIPPQEVQSAHTDTEVEGLDHLIVALAQRPPKEDGTRESVSDWRLWWHSHARMQTGPSGTDTTTLRVLAEQMDDGWFIGMVTNVRSERTCWTHIVKPFALVVNNVDVKVQGAVDPRLAAALAEVDKIREELTSGLEAEIKSIMETNVKKKSWSYNNNTRQTGGVANGKAFQPKPNTAAVHRPVKAGLTSKKPIMEMTNAEFAAWVRNGGDDKEEEPVQALLPSGLHPMHDPDMYYSE